MANIVLVQGVQAIIRNRMRVQKNMLAAKRRGLLKACLFLQRESQKIVPVRYGILRNSAFSRVEGEGAKMTGVVGYTAHYAIYVHENLNARHAPGKTAKYLSGPMRVHAETLRKIIEGELAKGGRASGSVSGGSRGTGTNADAARARRSDGRKRRPRGRGV